MRIFVTGGTGFIGSHFIKQALQAGHQIVAVRRFGSEPVIDLSEQPEWIISSLDLVTYESLTGCDALIHFAAQGVSPQPTNWNQAFEVNVHQSISLFERAIEAGIPHLIACGSCFEYGKTSDRYDQIPPDAPLQPIGPYAASKAAFSLALEAMARTSTASFTILRPFHLFGEGQHPSNFWPSLRQHAFAGSDFPMTEGAQIRDYMSVEHAATKFLTTVESFQSPQKLTIANLGSGVPVSLREFASFWWREWNAKGKIQFGRIPYRTNEIMKFVPKI